MISSLEQQINSLFLQKISEFNISNNDLNSLIIKSIENQLKETSIQLEELERLSPIVKRNLNKSLLHSMPVSFLLYYMCLFHKTTILRNEDLVVSELRPFFMDLGISINDLG